MRVFKVAALPIADLSVTYVWWEDVPRTLPSGTSRHTIAANMIQAFDSNYEGPMQRIYKNIFQTLTAKAKEEVNLMESRTVPLFVAARLQVMGYHFSPAFVDGGVLPFSEVELDL